MSRLGGIWALVGVLAFGSACGNEEGGPPFWFVDFGARGKGGVGGQGEWSLGVSLERSVNVGRIEELEVTIEPEGAPAFPLENLGKGHFGGTWTGNASTFTCVVTRDGVAVKKTTQWGPTWFSVRGTRVDSTHVRIDWTPNNDPRVDNVNLFYFADAGSEGTISAPHYDLGTWTLEDRGGAVRVGVSKFQNPYGKGASGTEDFVSFALRIDGPVEVRPQRAPCPRTSGVGMTWAWPCDEGNL